ncbi:hypothetical protein NIT60_00040 [Mammaliicoccus sciuri]|nr:hypothetical protein NIT60_00040 [Mammaliicoccus sciuri]
MLYKKYTNLKIINVINLCLGTLFIVSLSYSIYLTHVNQPWAYFHTFTRVWEFSLGGLLAINLNKIKINRVVASLIGWLGLIGLILTGIIFNVSTMFPGLLHYGQCYVPYLYLFPVTMKLNMVLRNS